MVRITEHPILTTQSESRGSSPWVQFWFEDACIDAVEGEPIAAALAAADIVHLRDSQRFGQARGIFCGIGQCQDCVMIVDGVPNIRTCVTPVRAGMRVQRQHGRGEP
jgi:sarcosine oxidase subunit alpha